MSDASRARSRMRSSDSLVPEPGASSTTSRRPRRALVVKRLLDVTLSLCALIAAAPLLLLVAIAIRITMGSPVLFRQVRPGLHGSPFAILKFRSMSAATDEDGELLPETERLTRLGYWLRKTSFDELPELWNVVRGEMSLVGPRPLLMEYLPYYDARQMRRHDMRPGVTGLAQVRGRHALDWDTRFEIDVRYVERWSLRLDARVMRDTLSVLLDGQSGFAPGSEPPRFDEVSARPETAAVNGRASSTGAERPTPEVPGHAAPPGGTAAEKEA